MGKTNVSSVDMTHRIEQMLDKINALRNENNALRNALRPFVSEGKIIRDVIYQARKTYNESGKI